MLEINQYAFRYTTRRYIDTGMTASSMVEYSDVSASILENLNIEEPTTLTEKANDVSRTR